MNETIEWTFMRFQDETSSMEYFVQSSIALDIH